MLKIVKRVKPNKHTKNDSDDYVILSKSDYEKLVKIAKTQSPKNNYEWVMSKLNIDIMTNLIYEMDDTCKHCAYYSYPDGCIIDDTRRNSLCREGTKLWLKSDSEVHKFER